MNMESANNDLTDYEKLIFSQIEEKVKLDKGYKIDPSRPDYDQFIAAIKKYSDIWNGAIEFNQDYTRFKRVLPFTFYSNLPHLWIQIKLISQN